MINDSHRLADRQANYLYFRSLLTSERKKFCILSKIRTYYFAKLYLCISLAVDFSYEQTPGFKSLKFTVFMFFKFYRTVFRYYLLIVSVILLYIYSSVWANEAKCNWFQRLWSHRWRDPQPNSREIVLPRNLDLGWKSSGVRGDYAKINNQIPIIRNRSPATIKHHPYCNVSTSLFFPPNLYKSHCGSLCFWLRWFQLPFVAHLLCSDWEPVRE